MHFARPARITWVWPRKPSQRFSPSRCSALAKPLALPNPGPLARSPPKPKNMTTKSSEIIARRTTFSGTHVCLWADGAITWPLGRYIKGSPQPRTPEQREAALVAGWLVMGEIEIIEDCDVSALIAAARWTAKRDRLPGTVRTRFHAQQNKRAQLRPAWVNLRADRAGKPTERVWRLPRLGAWAGYVVWDQPNRNNRYELACRVIGTEDTYKSTGFSFANQAQLLTHLADNAPVTGVQ